MSGEYLLAIDNGTQSVRALLFDLQGNLIYRERVPIEQPVSPGPDLAEQDPEVFWGAVCQACQALFRRAPEVRDALAGVTITTQRQTMIFMGKDGKPLRPAIVWMDTRRALGMKRLGGVWGGLFALSGMTETVAYLQSESEANWVMLNEPEVWKNTHKTLFLSGYLTYRMTGNYRDSVACQVGYVPFDFKNLRWSASWDWKWQVLPHKKSMLPDLVRPGETLGVITPEAAAATGLPEGLPVVAAAADKACEVIGAGCLEPHIACLSYASAATVNITSPRYVEVVPLIPPYPAAVPDAYSLEVQIFRGYWMVSWFKREFGQLEVELAEEQNAEPEELFDELVRRVPAGSDGLILQPYWAPGLKVPGPEARGAVVGFSDVHTRAHLYRAILEGLAYALRDGAERISRRSGVKIDEVRVAGGGSQSDAACQLTADIFGLPVSRPKVYEASGLGAAIDAAVGLGLHPNFDTAIREMTHLGDTFEPNPDTHRMYDALYKRVYLKLYDRLHPLYDEIRDITGYPPRL